MIYQVLHFPPERHSSENYHTVGIYTTKTLALEVARVLDGEWLIVEFGLNRIDAGTCIWDHEADQGTDYAVSAYRRHWPTGIPTLKTSGRD